MSIIDFFHEAPALAILLTLGYASLWGVFIYMFVRLYRR